jgi:hypothetical protein
MDTFTLPVYYKLEIYKWYVSPWRDFTHICQRRQWNLNKWLHISVGAFITLIELYEECKLKYIENTLRKHRNTTFYGNPFRNSSSQILFNGLAGRQLLHSLIEPGSMPVH